MERKLSPVPVVSAAQSKKKRKSSNEEEILKSIEEEPETGNEKCDETQISKSDKKKQKKSSEETNETTQGDLIEKWQIDRFGKNLLSIWTDCLSSGSASQTVGENKVKSKFVEPENY